MHVQPVLCIGCGIEGLVYINGRLAGETGPQTPLSVPVTPGGCVYLEYRPLLPGYLPLCRRLTLGGDMEAGEGLYVLVWPSGVIEVEVSPEKQENRDAQRELALPDYALEPEEIRRGESILCVGNCRDGGRYLAAFDTWGRCALEARGDESYFTQSGDMRLFRRENDVVGHACLLTYREENGALALAERENMWAPGGPVWPDSPEKTALAAVEAAMLGLWDEAEGYFLMEKWSACRKTLKDCCAYECAAPMRFPMPDGRSAIALCRATGERCGEVRAMYYHAVPGGGPQGMWQLDRIGI
jgi:hypothetical protein